MLLFGVLDAMTVLATIAIVCAVIFVSLWWRQVRMLDRHRERNAEELARVRQDIDKTYQRSEMLHRMVDGIGDGLLILNAEGRVLFLNKAMHHFFPPVNEPVGRSLIQCLPDARIVEMIQQATRTGQRTLEDFHVLANDRSAPTVEERVYTVEAVPLADDTRPLVKDSLLVILRDETAKHTLERIRQDFVANASHELRTPMAIINGYLENLLEGDITDPAEMQRVFGIMKKHGDRLAQIVQNLLLISRMESGDSDALNAEDFDFESCARDVIHRLTPLITAKEARVEILAPPKGARNIHGDRFYWDQILFNLVQNALKENEGKGLRVAIELRQGESDSEIYVRDNGVGIPAADLPYVFKRFYRVAKDRAQKIRGTGLGLSIVKRAVEAHKGEIAARSQPGIQTEFAIRVPRLGAAVAAASTPSPAK
jgi:signal transduction histidine kinase